MKLTIKFSCIILFSAMPILSFSQRLSVSGRITDAVTSEPLARFSVTEHNSRTGTITSEDGFYSLLLNRGEAEMVFESPGYDTFTYSFELVSDTVINVSMVHSVTDKLKRNRRDALEAQLQNSLQKREKEH